MISAADAEFMTRLCGPQINGAMHDMFESAKSVDFTGDNYEPAISALVSSIVYGGIGGACVGWSFSENKDGCAIAILRIKQAKAA